MRDNKNGVLHTPTRIITACFALAVALTIGCSSKSDDEPQPQPSTSGVDTGDSSSSDYTGGGGSSSWNDMENGGYSSSSEDNSQKEVVSTKIQTLTSYNLSNGEITGTYEYRMEYEYNPDGSLKHYINV